MSQINLKNTAIVTRTIACVLHAAILKLNIAFKGDDPLCHNIIDSAINGAFVSTCETHDAVIGLSTEFTSRINTPAAVLSMYNALSPYVDEAEIQAVELYQLRGKELGINLINIGEWACRFIVINFIKQNLRGITGKLFEMNHDKISEISETSNSFSRFSVELSDLLEDALRHYTPE